MSKKDDSCLVYTLKYRKVEFLPLERVNNKTLSQAYIITYCLIGKRKGGGCAKYQFHKILNSV